MGGLRPDQHKRKRRELLSALGFVLAAALLLYIPAQGQAALGQIMRASVLSPFIEVNGMLTRAGERATDFEVLRAQMDSAISLLAAQRTLAEENRQLRGLLSLKDPRRSRFVAATVLRAGTPGAESVFSLDVGRDRAITPFSPVITENGVLGAVQEVHEFSSLAIDWSHPEFRVSAMTVDGQFHGLVEPERGRYREQDRMILQGTAFLSDLPKGTELVTSGRGSVFPRGILIGWVDDVAMASSGWSKGYYVVPAVYPGSVSHALVELPRPDAEEGPGEPLGTGAR